MLICMVGLAEGQGAPFEERFSDFSTSPKSIKTKKIMEAPQTVTAPKLPISPQQPAKDHPPPAAKERKLSRREIVDQIRVEAKKIRELKEKLKNTR